MKQLNPLLAQVEVLQLLYKELGEEKETLDRHDKFEMEDYHSIGFARKRIAGLIYRISQKHIQPNGEIKWA